MYGQGAQIRDATQTLATLDGTIRGLALPNIRKYSVLRGACEGAWPRCKQWCILAVKCHPNTCHSASCPRPQEHAVKLNPEPVADSYQFSISSLTALAGRWITSPAAMRLTTVSSSLRMTPAMFTAPPSPCQVSSTAISDSEYT